MKRFSAAAAAIISSVVLLAGCANASDPASKAEEEARISVLEDLHKQGFVVDAVGPFAHTEPSAESPVTAVNVRISIQGPRECLADVLAVPARGGPAYGWRVTDGLAVLKGQEPIAMSPEDAVKRYHCDGG